MKIEAVYETDNSTYVILELLSMSLFAYLQMFGFPEMLGVKKIMRDLASGISYLHSKGIMHRDLKLENIMMREKCKSDVHAVIIDFGLAEYADSTKYLYSRCGTPGYVAPEVLQTRN